MGIKKLRQRFWVYNSEKLVPAVDRRQSSDFDVYTERFAGSHGVDNATWRRGISREQILILLGTIHVSPFTKGI